MAEFWQKIPRLGEVIQAFSYTPRTFRLVWETSPWATVGLAFLTLGGALLPAAQGWVGKLIVDAVVLAIQSQAEPAKIRAVFVLLILELGLFLSSTLISQARGLLQQILQLALGNKINGEVIRKALTLDLSFFENPDFYDRLQNARRQADRRPVELIDDSFMIVQNAITVVSFAVLLYRFSPWVVVILLVTTIPAFVAEARYSQEAFRLLTWRAPETRRLNYLSRLLTEDSSVKEVKLFNLGESLLQRYLTLFEKFFREDKSLAVRRTLAGFVLGLVATVGFYARERDPLLETVTILGRKRHLGIERFSDQRSFDGTPHVEAIVAAPGDFALHTEFITRAASHDVDRAADGIAAEQGALRAFQHLKTFDVEQVHVGADRAGQVNAIHVNANARLQVEREVLLPDAADICGKHVVAGAEGRGGIHVYVG